MYLITESLYLFTSISLFPPPLSPWQPFFYSLFLLWLFFFFFLKIPHIKYDAKFPGGLVIKDPPANIYIYIYILLLLFSCKDMSDPLKTSWIIARQAPLSMGFPRQEYWNGLPFPSLGNLPNTRIKPMSPALAGRSFTTRPPGTLHICVCVCVCVCVTFCWSPDNNAVKQMLFYLYFRDEGTEA